MRVVLVWNQDHAPFSYAATNPPFFRTRSILVPRWSLFVFHASRAIRINLPT